MTASPARPLVMLTVFIAFWTWMAFYPKDRTIWMLENALVVITVPLLVFTYRRFRFSDGSYFVLFLFLCIHTYAAHYTYQFTPFDDWLKRIYPGAARSYFDRIVHFLFGLLLVIPAREFYMRRSGQRGGWSYAVPAAMIVTLSTFFEVIEMAVGLLGQGAGQDYVGMQGDVFDSEKDMALAGLGALLTLGIIAWRSRKRTKAYAS
ncbi:DUF2238 domain-containing protein [Paenibacillus mucilaginosus]|uniref:Putative integral membrane protein n=2 Tax=Paenibacillus mucilaginosus TaxID=61624 RepID=H6NGI3_9BACL|nr:DUF2238 domain-containing protein [Paenibacillus mucilaginosus]AEI45338.1 putative integral membrane protein [Paenibacillus mucilaginosus KNP414]AFC33065.1 putative integral membrane protein [Paenibacillus mucilaginosus 3016]MCG7212781.1 DUF2238 domain-containing protein [Paenibacillus mucilaginosus]WDM26793.1 DUF2238 domain-containing protein [Paenibacillus mucilaginosus]WFA21503.1 DUF2238 domain-containing protein [Paenibacillus mucilaginosus]